MAFLQSSIAALRITILSSCPEQNNLETRMYGLIHGDAPAHKAVEAELAKLRTEGFGYLALERNPEDFQELSDYLEGKKTHEELFERDDDLTNNLPIINLIREARRLGYFIIPIDKKIKEREDYRDKDMLETLNREVPAGEKVVVVIGGWHINKEDQVYPLDNRVRAPLGKFLTE